MKLFEMTSPMGHHGDTWCRINELGLANFDVAFQWGANAVVLRVPDDFDWHVWQAAYRAVRSTPEGSGSAQGQTNPYWEKMWRLAAKFRAGETWS